MSTEQSNNAGQENPWPSHVAPLPGVPPVNVLRRQVTLLKQLTNGVLDGSVASDEDDNDSVIHSFYIVAPRLDDYRFRVISLAHQIDHPYPAYVIYDAAQSYDVSRMKQMAWSHAVYAEISDEAALYERLRHTFNSDKVIRVMQSLLAQSQTEVPA
jgi:hypothetical protein